MDTRLRHWAYSGMQRTIDTIIQSAHSISNTYKAVQSNVVASLSAGPPAASPDISLTSSHSGAWFAGPDDALNVTLDLRAPHDYALVFASLSTHGQHSPTESTIDKASKLRLLGSDSAANILVGLLCLWWLLRSYEQCKRAQSYRSLTKANDCGLSTSIPKSFWSGVQHKLELITTPEEDIIDKSWEQKFGRYGVTHALSDGYGVPRTIHTAEPANINAILSTRSADWGPSQRRASVFSPLAPEALGIMDGHIWARNRKQFMRHIGTYRAKDTRSNEPEVQLFLEAIGPVGEDGWTKEVDLLDLCLRMALDATAKYLLGTSFGAQAKGIKERSNTSSKAEQPRINGQTWEEAFDIVRSYFSWRAKLGSFYWLADGPKYRRACDTLNGFVDEVIIKAIEHAKQHPDNDARFGLVGSLVRERGADKVKIRDVIMDILMAGQNMTAATAAWVFARLEHHRRWYHVLREEVVSVFGTEDNPKAPITWDNLRACKNMQNVMSETLRLYATLPALGRFARRDTVLPSGGGLDGKQPIAIPKGTTASCNLYVMFKREEYWGSDALEFDPDRWNLRKAGPEYIPFGVGPRFCIGMQLAMGEITYLLARIMQRFHEIDAMSGQDSLEKGYHILVVPKNGVKVRFQQA